MGRGGYNGGGTIIGWGARWSDWRQFPYPEPASALPRPVSKRAGRRARARAAADAAKRGDALPEKSKLSPQQLFAGLGLLPLPAKLHKRGEILKRLVAEGLLLPTGRPNPDHPDVRAIEARLETGK